MADSMVFEMGHLKVASMVLKWVAEKAASKAVKKVALKAMMSDYQ